MSRVIRSPLSGLDIRRIALYIGMDNPAAAEKLVETFDEKLHQAAGTPGIGRPRDEVAAGLRSLAVGNFLLLYQVIEDGIELVRVVHGARDLRRLFRQPIQQADEEQE